MVIRAEILKQIDEIRNDKTHGAGYFARQAISVLRFLAENSQAMNVVEFLTEQETFCRELMSARPAMAPVSNIVMRLFETTTANTGDKDLTALKKLTLSVADKLFNDSHDSAAKIAEHGAVLLNRYSNILTHSYSSTVVDILKKAFSKYSIKVTVTSETTARELGDYGIPVTYIASTAMGLYIPTVNIVIVGADRICNDGGVVNGIGTYLLALASNKAGVPFYVTCDSLKFDPGLGSTDVDLEEKEPSEIIDPSRLPAGTVIKNPYFDITPPELVTAIITENGISGIAEVIEYMEKQSTGMI